MSDLPPPPEPPTPTERTRRVAFAERQLLRAPGNQRVAERALMDQFRISRRQALRYIKAARTGWAVEAARDAGKDIAMRKAEHRQMLQTAIAEAYTLGDVKAVIAGVKALTELEGTNAATLAKLEVDLPIDKLTDTALDATLARHGIQVVRTGKAAN